MDKPDEIPQFAEGQAAKRRLPGLSRSRLIVVCTVIALGIALQILARIYNLPLMLNAPADDGEHLRWKKLLPAQPGDHLSADPVSGEALIGSQARNLYRLDSEGKLRKLFGLKHARGERHYIKDVDVTADGKILIMFSRLGADFRSRSGIALLNGEGEAIAGYELETDPKFLSIAGELGLLFVADEKEGSLRALDLEQQELWTFKTPLRPGRESAGLAHACVVPSGKLFVIDAGTTLQRIDPASGQIIWESSHHRFDSQETVEAPDGSLRAVALINRVVAYSPDGEELWSQNFYNGEQNWHSSHAVSPANVTYFLQQHETLHMLTPDGRTLWSKALSIPEIIGLSAGPSDVVYIASFAGSLSAFGPDGALLWENSGLQPLCGPPLVMPDGSLICTSYNRLYCFEP